MKLTSRRRTMPFVTALPIGAVGSNAQALASLLIGLRPKTTIVSGPVGHRKNIDSSPAKAVIPRAPSAKRHLRPISRRRCSAH
jgi:hypothetical protein